MTETRMDFFEGRLFFSQSELFVRFLNSSNWLKKSRSSKKALLLGTCKQSINDRLASRRDQIAERSKIKLLKSYLRFNDSIGLTKKKNAAVEYTQNRRTQLQNKQSRAHCTFNNTFPFKQVCKKMTKWRKGKEPK